MPMLQLNIVYQTKLSEYRLSNNMFTVSNFNSDNVHAHVATECKLRSTECTCIFYCR
jgi:hypothetical protein